MRNKAYRATCVPRQKPSHLGRCTVIRISSHSQKVRHQSMVVPVELPLRTSIATAVQARDMSLVSCAAQLPSSPDVRRDRYRHPFAAIKTPLTSTGTATAIAAFASAAAAAASTALRVRNTAVASSRVSHLVRMSSEAMVRKASSTLEAFLALVSKNGMPNDSAYSFAAALSTTLSSRSLLLPVSLQHRQRGMHAEDTAVTQKQTKKLVTFLFGS